jgi:hypothetical protein
MLNWDGLVVTSFDIFYRATILSLSLWVVVLDKLRRLPAELKETEALLRLPSVKGNVREVLENLKADLEKQITALDRRQQSRT